MDCEPSLETVRQAINALYNSPEISVKEKANSWLLDLQRSVHAWKISDELISQCADIESNYFGARLLREKIVYNIYELTPEAVDSLRDSLLQHVMKIDENVHSIIITQICLAMVDLAIQINSWKTPVTFFLTKYKEIRPLVLVEILTLFPEEVESKTMRLGSNRRSEVFEELFACIPHINAYLDTLIQLEAPYTSQITVRAIKCFSCWISAVADSTKISPFLNVGVLPKVLHYLNNVTDKIYQSDSVEAQIHDASTDCLCALLHSLKSSNEKLDDDKLFADIVSMQPAYYGTVAHECSEKLSNYCRIFSELAETYLLKMFVESNPPLLQYTAKSLDLVLTCVGHHDYEVALITFHLWYELSENLYERGGDQLAEAFAPFIHRLLVSLCRHVQMEPDHEGLLDPSDEFKGFRDKVAELTRDVIFVVGSTEFFKSLFESLQNTPNSWDQTEAILFMMQAVAKNLLPDDDVVVPKTVDAIFSLPEDTHIAVKYTAIMLIGELAEWFSYHPDKLGPVLSYLVYKMQTEELANVSASAWFDICNMSKKSLVHHFTPLLQVVKNVSAFRLSNESIILLLRGTVNVMSVLPPNEMMTVMKEICWLQAVELRSVMQRHPTTANIESRLELSKWIDRLAAVFRFTTCESDGTKNPCFPALQEIWPILIQLLEQYQSDVKIMERTCRCIRLAVRCVGRNIQELMESLITTAVTCYQKHPHSCFMYLGSVVVDECGDNACHWPILLHMLQAFVDRAFTFLRSDQDRQNHPDTIDDMFRLCIRIIQQMPVAFMRSDCLEPLIDCAIAASHLNHKEANSSVTKFFSELFATIHDPTSSKNELINVILSKHGATIVQHLIKASVFELHSYLLPNVASVISEFLQHDTNVAFQWISDAVEKLPKQNAVGVEITTPEQVKSCIEICKTAPSDKVITKVLRSLSYLYK